MAKRVGPPAPPPVRLTLGVTGHRAGHPGFAENEAGISAALVDILDAISSAVQTSPHALPLAAGAPVRLHSLLANGTDQLAAQMTLERGWDLVAPLPFGRDLNAAINALPTSLDDARALAAGENAADADVQARALAIRAITDRAQTFELADRDEALSALYFDKLANPSDFARAQLLAAESSARVALAGRILIEQSDIIIGVWDGVTTAHVGGTGHTIAAALDMGAPVIWIDPARPEDWRTLRAPEALADLRPDEQGGDHEAIAALVRDALEPDDEGGHPGLASLDRERWRSKSHFLSHGYRRIEALFGGPSDRSRFRSLTQVYEDPELSETGCGAALLSGVQKLPGMDVQFASKVSSIVRRFTWADGISAYLSDAYRGGMIVNFVLSSLAIVGGISYLPFVLADRKWGFALFELVLLIAILLITFVGQRKRWHGRWFETRRVAEYLRHAPLLLVLGVARPPGRWAKGAETSWPEFYVRQALRDVGLPGIKITAAYLRATLTGILEDHVTEQRDYHFAKAKRLTKVHHNLDRLSTFLFQLAVASVALYLALRGASAMDVIDSERVDHASKIFTVLGVLFPTFGAGIAGIRYFGDFERFAAISEVTAEKLDGVHSRIALLARSDERGLDYGRVAELAHATDDIVVAEIENWQAVFGGKHITVPV